MSGYVFERDVWSPSRVRSYLNCPRAWWLKYRSEIDLKATAPVHWRRGSVAHAALEAAYKAARQKQAQHHAQRMDAYLPEAEDGLAAAWVDYEMPDDEPMRDQLREQIRIVLAGLSAPAPGSIAGVEEELRADLGEGVTARAVLDLVFWVRPGWLHVRDWKTYSKLPTERELRQDPQMALCGHLAALRWPEAEKISVGIFSVPSNLEARAVLTEADRIEAADRVVAIAELADTDTVCAPTPSEWCDTCGVRALCPVWNPDGAQIGPQVDMAEVVQMREALDALDEF